MRLLVCASAYGLVIFVTLTLSTWCWTRAGWSVLNQGLAISLCSLVYPALVGFAGRIADKVGRARQASLAVFCAALFVLLLLLQTPESTVACFLLITACGAWYFPAIAGLISETADTNTDLPLYKRVGRYNLGWASGNFVGFFVSVCLALLTHQALGIGLGVGIMSLSCLGAGLFLWRHRTMPSYSTRSQQQASDPAPAFLGRYVLAARMGVFFGCMATSILTASLLAILSRPGVEFSTRSHQQLMQTVTFLSYSSGYIGSFLALSHWSGWIFKPICLWMLQLCVVIGALLLALLPLFGMVSLLGMVPIAVFMGIGFGAFYTASIFYSLRLPHGASKAAGVHETFVGAGNIAGPVSGGLCITLLAGFIPPVPGGGLFALGLIIMAVALTGILIQLPVVLLKNKSSVH